MTQSRTVAEAEAPFREEPERKRLRILEAARSVCERTGYEAATMDVIAAEARVSKGTLYNFFESKEQLFLSAVLAEHDQADAWIAARVGPSREPRARLEGLLDALVESFPQVARGMMVNLQLWAVVARDPEARSRMFADLEARYRRTGEDLRDTLRAGQRAGQFRADLDVDGLADGLAALFDGLVYRSVFDPANANAETLRAVLDALIRERVRVPEANEEAR
jgi:AcrR family transcriptional regulator